MARRTQSETRWTNWAGTYTVTPDVVAHPESPEQVAELIHVAERRDLSVKPIGAGHSFTDIGVTRGIQLRMDRMTGILRADAGTGLVTVAAGTTLAELNPALWQHGLALENLGDIDAQTISGAISTGTHGTGRLFGGIATQVRGLQLVLADGQIVECDADTRPELFRMARVGLGALGVITAVTLQCHPAFLLRAREEPRDYDALLETLSAEVNGHDHMEFYWFPHTRRVLTKTNDRLPLTAAADPVGRIRGWIDDELLSNTVFEGVNRLTTARPSLIPQANRIAARALSARQFTDRSYRVFASPRRVRFREMEYAVPRKALTYALDEIDSWLARHGEQVGFPVEVRFAAADDIPLSTAYGRETAYLAVHQYHRRSYERYFQAVERIVSSVEGRPHWGKLHFRTADQLAELYPEFGAFQSLREDLDPDRRFGNDYLRRVLGS